VTSLHQRLSLNGDDWLFKGFLEEEWFQREAHDPNTKDPRWWRAGTVPGSVHHDLWRHGEIPNPHYERNTLLMEWVPQRAWVYRKRFTVDESHAGKRLQLRFEGVDYEAHFFLNGTHLGDHRSMFTPALFDVSDVLHYGAENVLAVIIEPAPREQPQLGRTSLVRTSKTRMNYWWDFCPRLVHLGIWDHVVLDVTGSVRVEDVWVRPTLSDDFQQATLRVEIQLSSSEATTATIETKIRYGDEVVVRHKSEEQLEAGQTALAVELEVPAPRLWWPNGYGEQPLYQAEVRVLLGECESDRREVTFGIRRVEWVQNETPDKSALAYTAVVNGHKLYIKGWNWVPMDAMYGVERPAKLERLLTLAQRAHVNLLRLNGVGLIEKEAFYNLCDRLGIMVWQEFILSSSAVDRKPPEDEEYIEMIVREAEAIVPRKRNHPSLVIWGGGNELEGLDFLPLDDSEPAIAAQRAIVERLDPDRHWLPTSASGPMPFLGINTIRNRPTSLHDVHGPWHFQGLTQQHTLYNESTSLLHSEFGVEGLTNLRALRALFSPENLWPATRDNPVWYHLGAGWWLSETLWREFWGEMTTLETMVQATQFLQAEGVRYAIEANRRRKYQNSGSLPWQFDEPYPMAACTSAVDYYAQPKPLYHAVARAYAPLVVSATYSTQAWERRTDFEATIYALNSHEQSFARVMVNARLIGVSGRVYEAQQEEVSIQSNRAAELMQVRWSLADLREDVFFLDLSLFDGENRPLAQNRYVFSRTDTLSPLRSVPTTSLAIHREGEGGSWYLTITNAGEQAALWVWLEDGRDLLSDGYVYFSDNYFCLFPNESRTIAAEWSNVLEGERRIQLSGWNTAAMEITQDG
jgi:beta-mannosidase